MRADNERTTLDLLVLPCIIPSERAEPRTHRLSVRPRAPLQWVSCVLYDGRHVVPVGPVAARGMRLRKGTGMREQSS